MPIDPLSRNQPQWDRSSLSEPSGKVSDFQIKESPDPKKDTDDYISVLIGYYDFYISEFDLPELVEVRAKLAALQINLQKGGISPQDAVIEADRISGKYPLHSSKSLIFSFLESRRVYYFNLGTDAYLKCLDGDKAACRQLEEYNIKSDLIESIETQEDRGQISPYDAFIQVKDL